MKKLVVFVVVLALVLSFAAPALAAPTEGLDGTEFDIYEENPDNPETVIPVDELGKSVTYDPDDYLLQDELEQAALDSTVDDPDAIKADESQMISSAVVEQNIYDENGNIVGSEPVSEPGLFVFWDSTINSYDVVQLWQNWVDETGNEWYGLYDAVYDETDGSWNAWVDDVGLFSYYVALIQRGVDPEQAAQMAQQQAETNKTSEKTVTSSPKTSDNGASDALLWTIMILGIAGAAFAARKMVKAAK